MLDDLNQVMATVANELVTDGEVYRSSTGRDSGPVVLLREMSCFGTYGQVLCASPSVTSSFAMVTTVCTFFFTG